MYVYTEIVSNAQNVKVMGLRSLEIINYEKEQQLALKAWIKTYQYWRRSLGLK